MNQDSLKSGHNSMNAATRKQQVMSADEVKTRLREQGKTLKQWAADRGYPYSTVSNVVRGINRGTFGMGHRIAVELGLKRG